MKTKQQTLFFVNLTFTLNCHTGLWFFQKVQYILVQFSHSVVSDSLQPHGLQHARPPCPSPTPRVYSNWCPLSQWCYPTISSSVVPFSSCLQSFLASGSFPMSHFFASGGQSIRASALASVLPMNIQDWFPLGWTGWISLQSKGLPRVFSNTTVKKHQFSALSFLSSPTLTSIHALGYSALQYQLQIGSRIFMVNKICKSQVHYLYIKWHSTVGHPYPQI